MAAWACSATSNGRMASSVPWMMSVGTRTAASTSAIGRDERASSMVAIRTSGVVSSAQATPSSIGFVECGSVNTWLMKNSAKSA